MNHHQLLNEYVLHNFFATEKKKKCISFLEVSIMLLIVLCDTIYK